MAYKKSRIEVEQSLRFQIAAIESSMKAYDAGDLWEGVRIAAAVSIICHDKGRNVSLLTQLDIRDQIQFLSMSTKIHKDNLLPSHPLVMFRFGATSGYQPVLDQGPPTKRGRWFKFSKWWKDDPIAAAPKAKWIMTRDELVASMRDQDGGGHVDSTLTSEKYAEYSRSPGWMFTDETGAERELLGLEAATMRHIGWELTESLRDSKLNDSSSSF